MKMDGKMSKKARNDDKIGGVDRISSLPDQLLHHVLSFSDARLAVQTSVLSKRWKLIWTTLPVLNFTWSSKNTDFTFSSGIKFIDNIFSRRNNTSDVLKLNLFFFYESPQYRTPLVDKCTNYAISHNAREVNVDVLGADYTVTMKLIGLHAIVLNLKLPFDLYLKELDSCWPLPALTTLCLVRPDYLKPYKLPALYLFDLFALRTLLLDGFELPSSVSLPALRTLILHIVEFPENMSDFCRIFRALGNLRNLTLFFWTTLRCDCVIDCPQLVNLEINYCTSKSGKSIVSSNSGKILVLAPKILNFSSVGIFPIKFGAFDLENVNIQLRDSAVIKTVAPSKTKKIFHKQVTHMLVGLSRTKILALDSNTIEALSALSDFLVQTSSPFFMLEHVKVPHGYEESSMSTYLKWFLLGCCPKATIITILPQKIEIIEPASLAAQNVLPQGPLTDPTKVLVGSKKLHTKINDDRATQFDVTVEGLGNDGVSSSRRDSDFGLWQGHEVKSEFARLLHNIMNNYPETFEHFTTSDKKLSTMKLNMLCTSVNVFTKISMTQVDTEMIAEYRDVFAGLQKFGFNVSWLVSRLNYIEKLRNSQPLSELHVIDCNINSAKSKLQDLETLRKKKMEEIQKAFGSMGTNLAVGCIGNDLLRAPEFNGN
ncbi:uncharacterized protein LOC108208869 [Daucus carota subsp. sativus]|uniref:uncharacterized protein LOC108208869 n=1 Tax=Daucus carota subsp. sativus TaxID=79200 RepID=UPI0007EF351F|nr:PREDICTED: uncharacterized protein LOC108208869 [Daucus carota subsp. sativus]